MESSGRKKVASKEEACTSDVPPHRQVRAGVAFPSAGYRQARKPAHNSAAVTSTPQKSRSPANRRHANRPPLRRSLPHAPITTVTSCVRGAPPHFNVFQANGRTVHATAASQRCSHMPAMIPSFFSFARVRFRGNASRRVAFFKRSDTLALHHERAFFASSRCFRTCSSAIPPPTQTGRR